MRDKTFYFDTILITASVIGLIYVLINTVAWENEFPTIPTIIFMLIGGAATARLVKKMKKN